VLHYKFKGVSFFAGLIVLTAYCKEIGCYNGFYLIKNITIVAVNTQSSLLSLNELKKGQEVQRIKRKKPVFN